MTNEELHFQMLSGIITEGKYKLKLQENIFKNILNKLTGKNKEPIRKGEFDGLTDEQAQKIYDELKRMVGKPDKNYYDSYDQDATSMMITSTLRSLRILKDKYPNIVDNKSINESITGRLKQHSINIIDKNNIKTLLSKTFISEANVPGLDVTNKAKAESDKANKKAIKDMEKELSDYDKESKKQPKDVQNPVKFNYTDDSEAEYHQEMEIMNGQEMIQYDRTPSEEYKKRAEEAIEGSSRMGNNPEWANVVVSGQGGDPTFGKKLVKAIKASENKRNQQTPTSKMFGDDWEVVEDMGHKSYAFENKVNNKSQIKESKKMKKLTFHKPFNGINNALNLIPESYKVNNKTFVITDGNESYKVRWEGSLNEGKGVVLTASNKSLVNEDIQKIKHLMGYKSQDTFGNLKGVERLNEDKNFGDIWRKSKTMLTEGLDELTDAQKKTFDMNPGDKPFSDKDFTELRARKDEGSMYEAGMYEMDGTGKPDGATNAGIIKKTAMDTIKNDVPKMGAQEKETFNAIVTKLGDFFAMGGNQDSSTFATLKDRIISMIDGAMSKKGMAEGGMYETDRFNEVFDLGEESYNHTNESRIGNMFNKINPFKKFGDLINKAKNLSTTLKNKLGDEKMKEIGEFVSQNIPNSELSKLKGLDSNSDLDITNIETNETNEAISSGTFNKLKKLSIIGIPFSAIGSILSFTSSIYQGATDVPYALEIKDAMEPITGQYGGNIGLALLALTVGFLFLSGYFSYKQKNTKN